MNIRMTIEPGVVRGQWWHPLADGRIQCDLCPRACKLHAGQRGFCFVRQAREGGMVLTSYGRASGFCIDPIEKKPLNHFYPGTSVLSFGTAGCNLGCRFCQNWDISKARAMDRLSAWAQPDAVAEAAASASGDAASARVSTSFDLEMSQFWQKRQARLQPAVPKDSTELPGRKWLRGFFSIGSTQKPLERP